MERLALTLALSLAVATPALADFDVVNFGSSAYRIDGVNNPTLELTRGQTYVFNVSAIGHPFYIKTARVTGTGSQYTDGVTGQGVTSGTLTFTVPMDAPKGLFYQCGVHGPMGGAINILDAVGVSDRRVPDGVWLAPASPNPALDGATFRFGLPRGGAVELAVFDLRGRRVATLASGQRPAGAHTVRWDGRDLEGRAAPSGLYHVRLRFEGRMRSGRLVVLR